MNKNPNSQSQQSQYEENLNSIESEKQVRNLIAATTIERAYLSYRDRQMFILLKHAVRAAEQSWTYDILRKISPKEAELLNDPSVNAKVRFRFGGTEFPPIILFKIYLVSNGTKYISGKKIIRPASFAATDACRLMGHRKFYDQMITDACQFEKDKITDEVDVTTMKDYMQYLSNMDETPSYLGGKENYWRQLSLEALPRQSIMYDIMEYLHTKTASPRLQSEMPVLLSRPVTQDIQIEQFKVISRLLSPPTSAYPLMKTIFRHPQTADSQTQRRSVQSRKRVAKMRKLYGLESQPDSNDKDNKNIDLTVRASSPQSQQRVVTGNNNPSSNPASSHQVPPISGHRNTIKSRITEGDPEDNEAKELYEWTQELNFEDINKGFYSSRPTSNSRSVTFSSHLTKRVFVS